jgi:hypothetical protein
MLALQHRQLLPKSEIFQEQASMRLKQRVSRPNPNPAWQNMGNSHSRWGGLRKVCKLLISEPDKESTLGHYGWG